MPGSPRTGRFIPRIMTLSNINVGYALTMLAAVFAAGWLSLRRQSRLPLTRRQRAGIALGAFCGGMIGAKLPFVLSDWEGLLTGRAWLENGKTITFGLVGGYFGVEVAKVLCNVRMKTGDSFAVPVAVAPWRSAAFPVFRPGAATARRRRSPGERRSPTGSRGTRRRFTRRSFT
jgi:hypothetical protein